MKIAERVDLLMVPTSGTEHSGDFSSAITREESGSTMPYDESSTTLEEKSMQRLPTAFARTLSSIPSYEQTKRSNKMADSHLKFVVVGDGGVGKTCLLISYVQRQFPTEYIPTVFENYVTKIEGPRNTITELALWDTAGQEEYNRLRPLSYSEVDILMVCYAINNRTSLKNVQDLWIPEVKHFCPDVPIMLIGLKSDLNVRDNINDLVDPRTAEAMAKKLGAFVHIQCSSKLRYNVDEVFNTALNTALHDFLYSPKEFPPILKNPFKKKTSSTSGTDSTDKNNKKPSKKAIRRHRCTIL